jgi:serine/threonine protein kinase
VTHTRLRKIAMECCELGSMQDVLRALERGLTEDELRAVALQAVQGLEFLHKSRTIHRDIKAVRDGACACVGLTYSAGQSVAECTRPSQNLYAPALTHTLMVHAADFGVSASLKEAMERRQTAVGIHS